MDKIMKCTMCGCRITGVSAGQFAVCEACGCEYDVSSSSKLGEVSDVITNKLTNLRALQANSAKANDVRNLSKSSIGILEIVIDDYLSQYYYAYAENVLGNHKYISKFYKSTSCSCTPSSLMLILEHISNYGDLRDRAVIESYIIELNQIDNLLELKRYKKTFHEKKMQEENYDDIPRDVFVCHRSNDSIIANSVVDALESDGNKCWISTRNLRPNDSENYCTNIKQAISSCKMFLVVSSEDAMLSKDVKNEINTAKMLNKPRLEYKIDESVHTSMFNNFFDGKKWVEGFENSDRQLAILCSRVFKDIDVLSNSGNNEVDKVDEIKELIKKQGVAAGSMPNGNGNLKNLIKTAKMHLEDEEFEQADYALDRVAEIDIECAELWWLRLLSMMNVSSGDELACLTEDITWNKFYVKAIKFATVAERENWQRIASLIDKNIIAKQIDDEVKQKERERIERIRQEKQRIANQDRLVREKELREIEIAEQQKELDTYNKKTGKAVFVLVGVTITIAVIIILILNLR